MAAQPKEQPLPVNFGKRLAHTDKVVRDRGFKTLKIWLGKHQNLDRLEYMKLWKGLYFGMWMADKRPVQQELAVNIALLINDIPKERQCMWIDTFWETMQTAWEKLDVHRVNKYLLFTRIVIAEAFKSIRIAGWPTDRLQTIGETFTRSMPGSAAKVVQSVPSLGFILQFIRIFWEELLPEATKSPAAEPAALMHLLEPFCRVAQASPVRNLVARIHDHILRKAPRNVSALLSKRLLELAGEEDILQSNREALYDGADILERELRRPSPSMAAALSAAAAGGGADAEAAGSPAKKAKAKVRAKKKAKSAAKKKARNEGGLSPLLLPKAAHPLVESAAAPKKKKRKQSASDNAKEAPTKKKAKRKPAAAK